MVCKTLSYHYSKNNWGGTMNQDNVRLRDIQILKKGYGLKVLAAESKEEVEHYYSKIDELSAEENEILKRCDVII